MLDQETKVTGFNKLWWEKNGLGTDYLKGDLSSIEGRLRHNIKFDWNVFYENKESEKEICTNIKGDISWYEGSLVDIATNEWNLYPLSNRNIVFSCFGSFNCNIRFIKHRVVVTVITSEVQGKYLNLLINELDKILTEEKEAIKTTTITVDRIKYKIYNKSIGMSTMLCVKLKTIRS